MATCSTPKKRADKPVSNPLTLLINQIRDGLKRSMCHEGPNPSVHDLANKLSCSHGEILLAFRELRRRGYRCDVFALDLPVAFKDRPARHG
jgi:DNA-binding transcriptional regulator YhcF (GntR family)